MLTSMRRLPRLALPMLSAMLLLSLSGDPSPAQAPGPLVSKHAPGHVVETITPAATVVSSAHYQARVTLNCDGANCFGEIPKLGGRRRLNLTRMSCWLRGPSHTTFLFGHVSVNYDDGTPPLYQLLPVEHSAATDIFSHHTFNRAVDLQVTARQQLKVAFALSAAENGFCTATGTLDTLQ